MKLRHGFFGLVFLTWCPSVGAFSDSGQTIIVDTTEKLVESMVSENAGRNILIKAGTYCLNSSITVPAGSRVKGEGVMLFDEMGNPTGFAPNTGTRIIAGDGPVEGGNPCPSNDGPFVPDADFAVLKLEDHGSIRGIQITGVEPFGGNTIRIQAQGAERVRTRIVECDFQGPGGELFSETDRTIGRTIYIHTGVSIPDRVPPWDPEVENPLGDPQVEVEVYRSIIRGNINYPGSGMAFYVINHESKGRLSLFLGQNEIIEATTLLDAIGGGSRREYFSEGGVNFTVDNVLNEAKTEIISYRNHYRGFSFGVAFSITAGAAAPMGDIGTPGANYNELSLVSFYDDIEAVDLAVFAKAAFRSHKDHGRSHNNNMEIQMVGTAMETNFIDLFLVATIAGSPLDYVGDNNTLTFLGRHLTGSGVGHNTYATDFGPQASPGSGNATEFTGSLKAWQRTNEDIDDPPLELFQNLKRK